MTKEKSKDCIDYIIQQIIFYLGIFVLGTLIVNLIEIIFQPYLFLPLSGVYMLIGTLSLERKGYLDGVLVFLGAAGLIVFKVTTFSWAFLFVAVCLAAAFVQFSVRLNSSKMEEG